MQLYDMIFKRRSVRQYTMKLSSKKIKALNEFVSTSLKPLYNGIKYEIQIVDEVKNSRFDAPQYVLFYSEAKPNYKINAGFMIQQIDLFIQSIGAGSCWVGLAAPIEKELNGLTYVIMLAFGETDKPFRESDKDFKRKPLIEVGSIRDSDITKAIQVSPSAINAQPWYYEELDGMVSVYLRRKLIHKVILARYDLIDIGISILHYYLSLEQKSKTVRLKADSKNSDSIVDFEVI